jgi:hypothetical protein
MHAKGRNAAQGKSVCLTVLLTLEAKKAVKCASKELSNRSTGEAE